MGRKTGNVVTHCDPDRLRPRPEHRCRIARKAEVSPGLPHEGCESLADLYRAQRAEANRPGTAELLLKGMRNPSLSQRLDVPVGALVATRALKRGIQPVASVVERPD
jgi:hypothetical protein